MVLQAALPLVFVCIFCFTSVPGTATVIAFTAVLTVLSLAGAMVSGAGERRLKNRVAELLRELDVASSRIGSVSQEIGITIGESDRSTNTLFHEAGEMSTLTGDVTEQLGTMLAQLRAMISFSGEARSAAAAMDRAGAEALLSVQSGMAEIMRIVGTMHEIKVTSGKAGDSIEKLRAASDGVRAILDKVGGISKQMHIIAVNAAVEASRAGRSGASFAVVAGEFQSLSAMTDTAMGEIGALLDAIQRDIYEAYDAVKENSGRVDAGVLYTRVVEDSLKAIEASFSDVATTAGRISSLTGEESRLAGGMEGHIENVESLIDRTTGNVRRVYESALEQKSGIENIAEMGAKLHSASMELLGIASSDAAETTEKLDEKTGGICAQFFPVIRKALASHPDIQDNNPALHHEVLSRFKAAHPIAEAVWTNETNGRFICSIPEAGIANAAMRGWFISAMKGESFISPIYISGITKNRCVTLSMPYYNDGGAVAGIIGVDLNLDMLNKEKR
jgi:methyl-accepting chemotaxis protein